MGVPTEVAGPGTRRTPLRKRKFRRDAHQRVRHDPEKKEEEGPHKAGLP